MFFAGQIRQRSPGPIEQNGGLQLDLFTSDPGALWENKRNAWPTNLSLVYESLHGGKEERIHFCRCIFIFLFSHFLIMFFFSFQMFFLAAQVRLTHSG